MTYNVDKIVDEFATYLVVHELEPKDVILDYRNKIQNSFNGMENILNAIDTLMKAFNANWEIAGFDTADREYPIGDMQESVDRARTKLQIVADGGIL